MSETLRKAVEEVEEKLKAKLAEAAELKKAINQLLVMIGEPVRYHDVDVPAPGPSTTVRRDEFFGKSPVTAAREFLEKVQAPSTAEEILEGLKKGGFDFVSQGWKDGTRLRNLAISLGKNTQVFIRLPSDAFGLMKWYPDLKRKKVTASESASASAGAANDESTNEPSSKDPDQEG